MDIEALKREHAPLLEEIAQLAGHIKVLKDGGAAKDVVAAEVKKLGDLKEQLPLDLMSDQDRKRAVKKALSQERAAQQKAEKEARQAKWSSMKKDDDDSTKKKKKKGPVDSAVFVNVTPMGEKKNMSTPMDAAYNPQSVESAWDHWWEAQGHYKADVAASKAASKEDKFIMIIPPPNVTGKMHIGHALMISIEDALCRYHRMTGKHVLWLGGVDHAGIATQAVVEKKCLKDEGKTKHDYGRDAFVEKIWDWKNESGTNIFYQMRRLGATIDHSTTVFTMDDELSPCVTEAFVRLYESGLVYRSTRLVNWSHAMNTALSDIEVDHEEINGCALKHVRNHNPDKKYEFGTLTSFAYKIADDDGNATEDEIVVATTRLETMLGDSAVAVNPHDPRYTHLHGKRVVHPFRKCTIPIVCDEVLVDMSFGTGAVKITPAHDPNDFKCGRAHNLEEISILNDNGSINGVCGAPYENMMRFDARYQIEEDLKTLGLFRDKQSHSMVIPICSRSGDVIEPRLVPQWWMKCDDMAQKALDSAASGELKITPAFHNKTWERWLGNIQDWCISRQLWWGHRIPAYRVVDGDGQWFVGRSEQEAKEKASKALGIDASEFEMEQDPDVLDTWFSSGLFPFSPFGWAKEGQEDKLEAFFPGTLLETGHDILFFWVARMVMMSLELTGKLPFDTVLLHALVRDKWGRKMSKSLGNVVDPIHVIEGISLEELYKTLYAGNLPEKEIVKAKEGMQLDYPEGIPECGADSLRFGLLSYTSQGRDINLDINRVAAFRRFCNKLWQVTKFMLMNIGDTFQIDKNFLVNIASNEHVTLRDKWILNRLAVAVEACNKGFEEFDFSAVTGALHSFYLDSLCDVYVEAVKPVMWAGDEKKNPTEKVLLTKAAAQNTLWYCLDIALRLMHPIMPFVTEELWQRLPGREASESIAMAHYPGSRIAVRHLSIPGLQEESLALVSLKNQNVEADYSLVNTVAAGLRAVAMDYGVANQKLDFFISVNDDDAILSLLENGNDDLRVLGKAKSVTILAELPEGCAVGVPHPCVSVGLNLGGLVDTEKEIEKLGIELSKLESGLSTLENRVQDEKFLNSANEKAVTSCKEAITETELKIQSITVQLEKFKALSK